VEFVEDADGSNDGAYETLEGEVEIILDGLVEYVMLGIKEVVNDCVLESDIVGCTEFLIVAKDDGKADEISDGDEDCIKKGTSEG